MHKIRMTCVISLLSFCMCQICAVPNVACYIDFVVQFLVRLFSKLIFIYMYIFIYLFIYYLSNCTSTIANLNYFYFV